MSHRPNTHGTSPSQRHVSRRTVVKAGAHAAWSVPLIQLATAAPALAASGPAALSVSGPTPIEYSGVQKQTINLALTVTNSNSQATTALTVTCTFPSNATPAWAPTGTTTTDWTASNSGNVVTFRAVAQLGGNSTKSCNVTLSIPGGQTNNRGKGVDITVSAIPGGTGSSGQTVIHVNGT